MTHSIISQYTTRPFSDDDCLKADLGLDDIDLAGIAHSIWETHGLDISDEQISKWERVADVSACVASGITI